MYIYIKKYTHTIVWKFSGSWIILPLSSLSILITNVSNSVSGKLLVSILFSSFSGVFSYSFAWDIFLCLLILAAFMCLFLCISRSAISTSLDSAALYSRYPVCPVGVSCIDHVRPPFVVEPWLLFACQWVGLTLRLTGCEDWTQLPWELNTWSRICPCRVLVLMETTLWVLMGGASLWYKAGCQVCWFWSLLGRAQMQTEVSHCLCSAQGHLVGAMGCFSLGSSLCWAQRHIGDATLWPKAGCHLHWAWGYSAKGMGHAEASHCLPRAHTLESFKEILQHKLRLPVRHSCWKS